MAKKSLPKTRSGMVKRYIEADDFLVVVEVPVIYAEEEPNEPLLEAKTIRFLDDVTRRTRAGDRKWLAGVGKIYELAEAT